MLIVDYDNFDNLYFGTRVCSYIGTIQVCVRHARGVRGVRYVVVSRGGIIATSEAEEHKEPDN